MEATLVLEFQKPPTSIQNIAHHVMLEAQEPHDLLIVFLPIAVAVEALVVHAGGSYSGPLEGWGSVRLFHSQRIISERGRLT